MHFNTVPPTYLNFYVISIFHLKINTFLNNEIKVVGEFKTFDRIAFLWSGFQNFQNKKFWKSASVV